MRKIYFRNLKQLTNNIINPNNEILEKEIKKNKKLIKNISLIKKLI